ncbi:helix-turn-helix transcriptional regulator [Nonomuraea sp. WAC 01424]|uniref:helix-turn-helix transcriptional regulator n=1 Tax=Nonomuraea sp. WAC 01424 TaxID=2203200 RepID=UPI00163CB07C|nr:helix-turn-helix transcriptional regulator [Nonomuraea sp. WAC 01424]
MGITRSRRAQIQREATTIRMHAQRAGHATERIVSELRQALPELTMLEAWRLALGWSRAQVVDQVAAAYVSEGLRPPGLSEARLCRIEHGQERPGPEYAEMLARAYGTSAETLGLVPRCVCGGDRRATLQPSTSVTRRTGADTFSYRNDDDEGTDPMRRRTLLTAAGLSIPLAALQRVDDALALPPRTDSVEPAQIAARLRAAHRQFDRSELGDLVDGLPDLLASATAAAERVDTPAGWGLVAGSYRLATDTLNKIGTKATARLTADRAVLYAARSEDPVAVAASERALGMMLRIEGRPDLAAAVMTRGVDRLAATGLHTTAQALMFMRLLCARAYTYAWAGDRSRALEGIDEAEHAAARIPAMKSAALPFARLYRSNIHYALGDAGAALHAARDLRDGMYPTPERRGRLHTDLARAYWQWGKPEQTTAELLAAYQHAPAEVRDRPSIRKIAVELVERHPRVAGVRQLAKATPRPSALPAAI